MCVCVHRVSKQNEIEHVSVCLGLHGLSLSSCMLSEWRMTGEYTAGGGHVMLIAIFQFLPQNPPLSPFFLFLLEKIKPRKGK